MEDNFPKDIPDELKELIKSLMEGNEDISFEMYEIKLPNDNWIDDFLTILGSNGDSLDWGNYD